MQTEPLPPNRADVDRATRWHALPADAVFEQLDTRSEGLSDTEAGDRLARYGPNHLPRSVGRSAWRRLLSQFNNILIYVLLAAAGVTTTLGHFADAGVIIGVVVINALIGFIQEGKAEKALDSIRELLSHQATVLRDGRRATVPAEELVPGDIVMVRSGDKIPADLRLFRTRNLQVEEASLTGESMPVEKSTAAVGDDALLGDRTSMAFSSTLVTFGQGSGVVVATGLDTEIGRISAMLEEVQTLTTPLLRQIGRFGQLLTYWIVGLASATFLFGVLVRGYTPEEMFLAGVGLAVAAIPEGLPAIITITLALGVQRMAGRNAIICRLPAVETLGAVSVICSDKTGTLTRNEMTATSVVTHGRLYEVSGAGYDPHGGFSVDNLEVAPESSPELLELARAATLCNDAQVFRKAQRWLMEGNPTEGALITLGMKAGIDPTLAREEYPRTDAIPFESEHRFMATLHHDHAGHGFILLKGAPERVLDMCCQQRVDGEDLPLDPAYWHRQVECLGEQGQRVLAVAFRTADNVDSELEFDDVTGGLTLLGLVGIIDPPRDEAIAAVRHCRAAGIRVKMITGDHAVTARAIGAQMGIGDGRRALTGRDLEKMDDEALREAASGTDIFARASPENKLRLVEALQEDGRIIAMTGDGVNDAPALRRADVGVAMGVSGTEVAKEAAEMVLTDDNFASIANAVEEGRTVYANIKKSILFILPTNGAEALTVMGAILLGYALPITALQILWVNMITAVTLGLSLAFEPTEADTMRRPPRPADEPLLSGFLAWRIVFVSLIMVSGTFGLFLWETAAGMPLDEARTVAVNTLVLFEVFYLFNTRFIFDSVLCRNGLFGNPYVLLAAVSVVGFQLVFTYAPPMQSLFGTTALEGVTWLQMTGVALSVFLLLELEKSFVSGRQRKR